MPRPWLPGSGGSAAAARLSVTPGIGGTLSVNPSPGASAYGYMNTLLQKAQLYTYVKNVASFEYFYKLLKKYEDGGIVNPVQVYTMEQNLVKGIETMLTQLEPVSPVARPVPHPARSADHLPLELDDEPIQPMYDLIDRYEKTSIYYAQAVERQHGVRQDRRGGQDPRTVPQACWTESQPGLHRRIRQGQEQVGTHRRCRSSPKGRAAGKRWEELSDEQARGQAQDR